MSHIKAVGFEIEGGWDGKEGTSPFKDITLIRDGSINGQSLDGAPPIDPVHAGEAVSPILTWEKDDWQKWLTDHWPDADAKHRTNRTCGFHIHTSFHSMKDYMLLSQKSFLYELRTLFMETGKSMKIHNKHVFWERMEGLNRFCPLEFDTTKQMNLVRGNHHGRNERYGWLNFCWGVYQTIELRSLPTFRDLKLGLKFSGVYFDFIDSFLDRAQNTKVSYATTVTA